jgi:hypothetical protein
MNVGSQPRAEADGQPRPAKRKAQVQTKAQRKAKRAAVQRGESAAAPAQARRGGEGRGLLRRDDVGWEAQLAKLRKYRRKHGDCNVPQLWAEDPSLGSWVNISNRHGRCHA